MTLLFADPKGPLLGKDDPLTNSIRDFRTPLWNRGVANGYFGLFELFYSLVSETELEKFSQGISSSSSILCK